MVDRERERERENVWKRQRVAGRGKQEPSSENGLLLVAQNRGLSCFDLGLTRIALPWISLHSFYSQSLHYQRQPLERPRVRERKTFVAVVYISGEEMLYQPAFRWRQVLKTSFRRDTARSGVVLAVFWKREKRPGKGPIIARSSKVRYTIQYRTVQVPVLRTEKVIIIDFSCLMKQDPRRLSRAEEKEKKPEQCVRRIMNE